MSPQQEAVTSAEHLGERLRAARETVGMSTRTVARRMSMIGVPVSHATIGNYESGRSLPSTAALEAFAKAYGRPREWFTASSATLTGVRYRSLKAVRVGDKRKYEGEALSWLEAYLEVENLVQDALPVKKLVEIDKGTTGEQAAGLVRKHFKLGPKMPVPSVVEILEAFGTRVIELETEARIDGLAAHLGRVPVVVLNNTLSNDRIRLNAAHELGHHLFEDCIQGDRLDDKEVEKRALEFASHLLLPEPALRDAFATKSVVRLVQFKEKYGISLAAMIYRARHSEPPLIKQNEYEKLWREFGRLGWRKNEPGYVPPDRPTRMEEMFDTAVQQNLMSYSDLSRLSAMPEPVIRQRVLRAMGGSGEPDDGLSGPSFKINAYRGKANP